MRWIINFSVSFCLWLSGILADENASIPVLPLEYRLNGKSTQHAFGQARAEALHSTVRLTRNGKLIAMGALVSSEGHVLTKASSCVGAREATLHNGKSYKLKIKKRNEETLGKLFCFFTLEVILLSRLLKVNPLDQPEVELVKKETFKILKD